MPEESAIYISDRQMDQYTSPDSHFIFSEDVATRGPVHIASDAFSPNSEMVDEDIAPQGWSPRPDLDAPEFNVHDTKSLSLVDHFVPYQRPSWPTAVERRSEVDYTNPEQLIAPELPPPKSLAARPAHPAQLMLDGRYALQSVQNTGSVVPAHSHHSWTAPAMQSGLSTHVSPMMYPAYHAEAGVNNEQYPVESSWGTQSSEVDLAAVCLPCTHGK